MYLFFDTETTGLPTQWGAPASRVDVWPRMVQLACVLTDERGTTLEQRNFIIRPESYHIPADATRVHRITTDRATREGVNLEAALADFAGLLDRATHLVAHNMEFDECVVGAEFHRKTGRDPLPPKPKICTMKSERVIGYCALPPIRYGSYKWPKLSELHAKLFGSDFEEAHDASVDIQATVRCFFKLRALGLV